jgi:hypothetical protein
MSPQRDDLRRPPPRVEGRDRHRDPDVPPDAKDEVEAGATPLSSDIEVPEADALAQVSPLGAPPWAAPRTSDIEAPEADALDQAAELPSDADDEYEHTLDSREEGAEEAGDLS